jgi:hypothetical protein
MIKAEETMTIMPTKARIRFFKKVLDRIKRNRFISRFFKSY